MQTFSGRDKAIESLIYRLTIHHAVRYGKCLVARSAHNASEIYGVAAWAAPGSDWDFQCVPTQSRSRTATRVPRASSS